MRPPLNLELLQSHRRVPLSWTPSPDITVEAMVKADIQRVLVTYKTSPYDRYDELGMLEAAQLGDTPLASGHKQILARLKSAHVQNQATIAEVQRVLARSGLEVTERQQPTKREAASVDLVITVGGDGTFLATAQRVEDAAMLGVNSAPATSVGHYCATDTQGFEAALDAVLAGAAPVTRLDRISCRVGSRVLPYLALNDVLFAHRSPASATRYLLRVEGEEEFQISSGLWLATASGASGAIGSAGGLPMAVGDTRLQYLVREPYVRQDETISLRTGLTAGPVSIVARSPKLQVFLDGYLRSQSVGFGTEVSLSVAANPLRVLGYGGWTP
jgi:NAD+ kinase